MGWNPHGAGSGTIKKIASKNTTRLSVTHPTGPTVTLTPKVSGAPGTHVSSFISTNGTSHMATGIIAVKIA